MLTLIAPVNAFNKLIKDKSSEQGTQTLISSECYLQVINRFFTNTITWLRKIAPESTI